MSLKSMHEARQKEMQQEEQQPPQPNISEMTQLLEKQQAEIVRLSSEKQKLESTVQEQHQTLEEMTKTINQTSAPQQTSVPKQTPQGNEDPDERDDEPTTDELIEANNRMIKLYKEMYSNISESKLIEFAQAAVANGKVFRIERKAGVWLRGEMDINEVRYADLAEDVIKAVGELYKQLYAAKDRRKPPRASIVDAPVRLQSLLDELDREQTEAWSISRQLNKLPTRPSTRGVFGRKKKLQQAAAWDRDVLPTLEKLERERASKRAVVDTIVQDICQDSELRKNTAVTKYKSYAVLESDLRMLQDAVRARIKDLDEAAAAERARSRPDTLKADPAAESAARKAFINAFLKVRDADRSRLKKIIKDTLEKAEDHKSITHETIVKEINDFIALIEKMSEKK